MESSGSFLTIIVITILSIGVIYLIFQMKQKNSTSPPYSPAPFWVNLAKNGYERVTHLFEQSQWINQNTSQNIATGCVYRLQIPWFGGIIICCDYKLARLLLQGNDEQGINESEKTTLTQNLNIYDKVCNLLTYKTANPDRIRARKFLSPAFSTNNLQKTTLDILYHRLDLIIVKFLQLSKSSSTDVIDMKNASVMLIFDILTESLFNISLSEGAIEGFDCQEFMNVEEESLREAVRRLMNPFRKYMFWDTSVQKANEARKKFIEYGSVILKAYQNNQFNLTADDNHEKTIMSHIMKHDYPSEEHRISDILVFLVAGHETTG